MIDPQLTDAQDVAQRLRNNCEHGLIDSISRAAMTEAADLIDRQSAEIERLTRERDEARVERDVMGNAHDRLFNRNCELSERLAAAEGLLLEILAAANRWAEGTREFWIPIRKAEALFASTPATETGDSREHEPLTGCEDCGRQYGNDHGFPDFIIPNDAWRQISTKHDEGGLLCPSCICARLAKAGMRNVYGAFMSGPIYSVSEPTMHTFRWMENLREQGHGWICPSCNSGREQAVQAKNSSK